MYREFSIGQFISFGWETFKKNFTFFLGLLVIVVLIFAILGSLESRIAERSVGAQFAFLVINPLIQAWITLGLIRVLLGFCDGRTGNILELFSETRSLVAYLIGGLVVGLITGVAGVFLATVFLMAASHYVPLNLDSTEAFQASLLLLLRNPLFLLAALVFFGLPLLALAVRLQLFQYYIVDQQAGPLESIARAWRATRGFTLQLMLFVFALILLNTLGFLLLVVGLLVTMPVSLLAFAAAYRTLAARQILASQSAQDTGYPTE